MPLADLLRGPVPDRHVGQRVVYRVLRHGHALNVPLELTRSAFWDQIGSLWKVYLVPVVLLLVASAVYLRRPRERAAQLMLTVGALLMAGTESSPLGPHVIDLVGGRGVWPYVISEIANALMWTVLLHFTLVFPTPSSILVRWPRSVIAVYALPFVLYGVVLLLRLPSAHSTLDRLEVLIGVSVPAAQVIPLLLVVLLVLAYRRSPDQLTRRHMRWVVGSLAGASFLYVALGQIPAALDGQPLIGWEWLQLAYITGPLTLAAAILRYRLFDIELILRRSLVYACVAAALLVVYFATLAVLSAWLPIHSQFVAFLAGGVAALVFRPVHDRLQRAVSRLAYGARNDPYEVISRIAQLDRNAQLDRDAQPSVLLAQLTDALVNALRLSYAAVEWVRADGTGEIAASTGTPEGVVETLPLTRGRDVVGRLLLCVKSGREPFGPLRPPTARWGHRPGQPAGRPGPAQLRERDACDHLIWPRLGR